MDSAILSYHPQFSIFHQRYILQRQKVIPPYGAQKKIIIAL
jgi:hypothetical protein